MCRREGGACLKNLYSKGRVESLTGLGGGGGGAPWAKCRISPRGGGGGAEPGAPYPLPVWLYLAAPQGMTEVRHPQERPVRA